MIEIAIHGMSCENRVRPGRAALDQVAVSLEAGPNHARVVSALDEKYDVAAVARA